MYADADSINKTDPLAASPPKNVSRPHGAYNPADPTTAVTVTVAGPAPQAYGYRGLGRPKAPPPPATPTAYATGPLGVTATTGARGHTGVVRDPAGVIVALRQPDGRAVPAGRRPRLDRRAHQRRHRRRRQPLRLRPYGRHHRDPLSGAVESPWRYTGAYQEPTGLYKLGARYYAPPSGGGRNGNRVRRATVRLRRRRPHRPHPGSKTSPAARSVMARRAREPGRRPGD